MVDGELSKNEIENAKNKGYKFYITHVQVDEIDNCPDEERRKKLHLFNAYISPTVISTESTVLGVSRLGFAKLGDGDKLDKIRGTHKDPKKLLKKSMDALLAETSINNQFVLITDDERLRKKVISMNGKTMYFKDFKKIVSK